MDELKEEVLLKIYLLIMIKIKNLLQNYFPANGVGKNSVQLTVVKLVTICASLVLTRILSQYLSLEEYGTYSQLLLIISVFTSFSILGLTDATNYFFNQQSNPEITRNCISSIFSIQYLAGTICALLIWCLRRRLADYFGNAAIENFCWIIAFMPLLGNLLPMYQNLFISIGKTRIIVWRNLLVSLIQLGVIAVICVAGYKIQTILLLLLLLNFFQVLYFAELFKKFSCGINILRSRRVFFVPILKYSLPMAFFIFLNALSRNVDQLFIGYFCNTADLAIYANSAKILPFDILTSSLALVMIPLLTRLVAENNTDKAFALLAAYLRVSLLATWSLALGAIFVAPELICLLYGRKYLPGLNIFILYIGVDILRFGNTSLVFSAKGKNHFLVIYGMGALVFNFVCNFLFFHLWGMLGPAIATVLTTGIMGILMLRHSASLLKGTLRQLLPWREILLLLLGIGIVGGCTFLFRRLLHDWGLPNFAVLCLSYGIFLLFIGIVFRKHFWAAWREINTFRV